MAGPVGGAMAGMNQMAGGDDIKKQAQTWLILSIVTFFCGCGLLAAAPAFFAWKAKQAAEAGDVQEFQSKIKIAKILTILGFVWFVVIVILQIVLQVMAS